MIVYSLACETGHEFDGWFGSAHEFDEQSRIGLLSCPVCGSASIVKRLSAPHINLRHAGSAPDAQTRQSVAMIDPAQEQLRALVRHVIESTEDVGARFAEEARRIHYDEAPARSIRGVASRDEARSLADEGIEVAQLPFAITDKARLN